MKHLLIVLGVSILLFSSCQKNPGELLANVTTKTEVKEALYLLGQDTTEAPPEGLPEGTIAPYFAAIDQNGKAISLSNLTNEGKAVIFFYRGYWCSICNRYLADFQDSLKLITDTGAKVIAIAPETAAYQERTIVKNNLSISVVSDKKQQIMNAYKVAYNVNKDYVDYIDVNLEKVNEANVLPVPATYIVNQNGTIEKVFFSLDWSKRPSIQSIIKALEVEYEEL
jgi:peroxiredoxin